MYHISHLFCTPGTKTNFFTSKKKTLRKRQSVFKIVCFSIIKLFSIHLFVCQNKNWFPTTSTRKLLSYSQGNFVTKCHFCLFLWDTFTKFKIVKSLLSFRAQKHNRGARKINLFTPMVELWNYDSRNLWSKKDSFFEHLYGPP